MAKALSPLSPVSGCDVVGGNVESRVEGLVLDMADKFSRFLFD